MKSDRKEKGKHEHPLPGEISPEQKEKNHNALEEAEKDMKKDPDQAVSKRTDDLDEGESARLGENIKDII
jgi:hypothetical protein